MKKKFKVQLVGNLITFSNHPLEWGEHQTGLVYTLLRSEEWLLVSRMHAICGTALYNVRYVPHCFCHCFSLFLGSTLKQAVSTVFTNPHPVFPISHIA